MVPRLGLQLPYAGPCFPSRSAIYDLAAQLLHVGGPEGGHFFTRTLSRGMWWTCDDARITFCPKHALEASRKDFYGWIFTKR